MSIQYQYILYQQYPKTWWKGQILLPDERDNQTMGIEDFIEGIYYSGLPEWGLYGFDPIGICENRDPFGLGSASAPNGTGPMEVIPFDPPDESWTFSEDVSFWDWTTLVLGGASVFFGLPYHPAGSDDYAYPLIYNPYFYNPGNAYTLYNKYFHVYWKDIEVQPVGMIPQVTALTLLGMATLFSGLPSASTPPSRKRS